MARDYKLKNVEYISSNEQESIVVPQIVKVYNEPGVPWREAKKRLRSFYLEQAASLRTISEKDYFAHKPSGEMGPEISGTGEAHQPVE